MVSEPSELTDITNADPRRQLIHACICGNAGTDSTQSSSDEAVVSGSLAAVPVASTIAPEVPVRTVNFPGILMQQGFDFCLLPSDFCLLLYT